MYAMDYPYQFIAEEVSQMDALPYPEDEKKEFFQGIAERLFNL